MKCTDTQQRITDDYAVLEDIASEVLLLLQSMNQPTPQDDNDDYALPVGTVKLPDLISEMNHERGIDMDINYDAEIPKDMQLQISKPMDSTHTDNINKDLESDETIIYDVNEFDLTTEGIMNPEDNNKDDDSEKSPKGKLTTQTFGIIKRKTTSKITYMCIDCGAKRNSK